MEGETRKRRRKQKRLSHWQIGPMCHKKCWQNIEDQCWNVRQNVGSSKVARAQIPIEALIYGESQDIRGKIFDGFICSTYAREICRSYLNFRFCDNVHECIYIRMCIFSHFLIISRYVFQGVFMIAPNILPFSRIFCT